MQENKYKLLILVLDEDELKQLYPKDDYKNAYDDIKVFLESNNFNYSFSNDKAVFYTSIKKLTELETIDIIKEANRKINWLKYCVKSLESMDIESPQIENITNLIK